MRRVLRGELHVRLFLCRAQKITRIFQRGEQLVTGTVRREFQFVRFDHEVSDATFFHFREDLLFRYAGAEFRNNAWNGEDAAGNPQVILRSSLRRRAGCWLPRRFHLRRVTMIAARGAKKENCQDW